MNDDENKCCNADSPVYYFSKPTRRSWVATSPQRHDSELSDCRLQPRHREETLDEDDDSETLDDPSTSENGTKQLNNKINNSEENSA